MGLTKRWSLYVASTATPGFLTDLASGGSNPYFTGSMRAVAPGASFWCLRPKPRSEQPSSKSQPPHLVFGYIYYCLLNLSSDHLLSGVKRRLVRNPAVRQSGKVRSGKAGPRRLLTLDRTASPAQSVEARRSRLPMARPGTRRILANVS